MKRQVSFVITLSLFFLLFFSGNSEPAMEDYCVVPPYVIQNVPPNIMIVVDSSGSMYSFAYYDGFNTITTTDDNNCGSNATPCTGFLTPGTYPTYKYYGYFNPDYWYTYSSNRFEPAGSKSGARPANSWDGNFLNWLTMRRVDIIRKVMTGGLSEASGSETRLVATKGVDCADWGKYKGITSAENYTPLSGTQSFTVNTSGGSCLGASGVRPASDFTVGGNTYNVKVKVLSSPEGVLQRVVGARARVGLTLYNSGGSGGKVVVSIGGTSLSSVVNQINNTGPNGYTPLGETLWTVTGYFAQIDRFQGYSAGPGPRYASGDYNINNTNDPYNFGTGGQGRWPTCAKSYVLFITDGEPCNDGNMPSGILNFAQTAGSNFNCGSPNATNYCPAVGPFSGGNISPPYCSSGAVAGIEDVALWMHTKDIRDYNTLGGTANSGNISGKQNLTLYTVFAFGKGSTLLRYAAINGGFEDSNNNNIPDLQSEWDNNNDGEPDNFYEATEGSELERAIEDAFLSILKRASSGTAASVLASGEGQGANLIQAVFYPRRRLGNDVIGWTGAIQNLWYHVDPYFSSSSIREETVQDSILNLTNDYIATLYFDNDLQKTRAKRFGDTDGDGDADTTESTVDLEDLRNLWEAGRLLWSRDLSTNPRKIYTTIDGNNFLTNGAENWGFAMANRSVLRPYLQTATDAEAENIVRYTHGEDIIQDANGDGINDYRERAVTIGSDRWVWKLSDILNSTPRIASWLQLNAYDARYSDKTYETFVKTNEYKNRGMVFAGGNDGMLHAFKLGTLELSWSGQSKPPQMARLTGSDLGKEMWAFIPKHALPYLKYITDPDYCHVYTVDLSPYLTDASIGEKSAGDISGSTKPDNGSTWRTILIGGMRTGGACRNTASNCTTSNLDCVSTPVDVGESSVGYSSYFALDVTDQESPQLLWEFSHPQLGFATTGPAIVRIGDKTKNGKWFVVFGSGPTGPISTADYQFLSRSDQNLRLFVLDLKTGSLASGYPKDTGIQYAFAGSIINGSEDPDLDYNVDAVYTGYIKRTGAGTAANPYRWTDGGLGRLVTYENPDPDTWRWRTVMDGIGPVTAGVARLQKDRGCYTTDPNDPDKVTEGCLWLFFGTGRYYYAKENELDDQNSQRRLFGVKERCIKKAGSGIKIDPDCTTPVTGLTDVSSVGNAPSETVANSKDFMGWYIDLDPSTTGRGAERVITDTTATITGFVFFTTIKPYTDVCAVGGKSFVWAVRYSTGGAPGDSLKGVVLLQVSTAAIEQLDLSKAFKQSATNPDSRGDRRSAEIEGLAPTQGPPEISAQLPVKRTIHMRER